MRPLFCLERECREVSKADRKMLLGRTDDLAQIPYNSLETANFHSFDLPFYSDIELLVITGQSWRPQGSRICFLRRDKETWHLNGTSPPIHEVNAKADLRINNETVLDYLAFFCFFVRGEEGPFFIVDRLENAFLPNNPKLDDIGEQFRQPRIWGQDENGDWRVSALVYYSDALFFADFVVQLGGMITMEEDTPVLANLGDRIDVPLKVEGVMSS